jgi:hypothetical protein
MYIASCGLCRDQGQLARIFYSPRETKVILNVSHAMLYRLIAAKRLDARKLGNKTLISAESIQRLAAELPAAKVGEAAEEEDEDDSDGEDDSDEEFTACRRHTRAPRMLSDMREPRISLQRINAILLPQTRPPRQLGANPVHAGRLVQSSVLRSTSVRPKGVAGRWVMSRAMQIARLPRGAGR